MTNNIGRMRCSGYLFWRMRPATTCDVIGTGPWNFQKAPRFSNSAGCRLRGLPSIYRNGMLEKNNGDLAGCFGSGRLFGIGGSDESNGRLAATSAGQTVA